MEQRACVLDERLVDLACAGKPDPAGCLNRCVTSGLEMIARGFQTAPPDLGRCVTCLADSYARFVAACGASCPACPADSPAADRCRACADGGKFFGACLK